MKLGKSKSIKTSSGSSGGFGSFGSGSSPGWLSRIGLAMMAGLSFGGKRSLYDVFGYPQKLTFEMMLTKYQRQDLAARVVDMPVEETWTYHPQVTLPDPESQKNFNELAARLQLWDRIIQVDKLCCFSPYTTLWIGLPGNQAQQANSVNGKDDFLYLQAYAGSNAIVHLYENDPTNPRYGQPLLYQMFVGPPGGMRRTVLVHYSRIIHIVDRPVQGLITGEPRMAQVYNVLDDLAKVGGGSAELFWLTANRGMQVDVDKDMDLSETDANSLAEEMDEFQHQLRRYIRTRGVKITDLGTTTADPRGVFLTLMSILAGATSIPQRILTGSEAGQLASEQDRANWATYIERRRKVFAEPYVMRPIIQKFEDLGYLKAGCAENAVYAWPQAFITNPIESAQVTANRSIAVKNYSMRNQYNDPIVTDEEARRELGLNGTPAPGETLPEPIAVIATPGQEGINAEATPVGGGNTLGKKGAVDGANKDFQQTNTDLSGQNNPDEVQGIGARAGARDAVKGTGAALENPGPNYQQ